MTTEEPSAGSTAKPEVSLSIKDPQSPAAQWLKANHRFLKLMGTLLAVVHSEQYEAGMEILERIQRDPGLLRETEYVEEMLRIWLCPFSGISLLCNSRTPPHRDIFGQVNWYDLLATVGTHSKHELQLPGLGVSLPYSPGTVIALNGRLLTHTADFADDGERAVFACFMRRDVRLGMQMPEGDYSTVETAVRPVNRPL